MSGWGAITWDVARAGGFTAYALLTLSVAVGLMLTLHMQSPRWPRIINAEMHNFLSLLALIFTGVHVLAVWLDPFTRFGLGEILVPFTSHYRPLWMALGIVALYLSLAIGLSTWVRPLIGYSWWRRLHVLTLASYALVTAHGIATGSDTRTWWGVLVYLASALLVGWLLLARLLRPATARGRTHPAWAAVTAGALLLGAVWAVGGPLQIGWNAFANNGQGSGARVALAASDSSSGGLTLPFSTALRGTLTQSGPDSSGTLTYDLSGTFQSGTAGRVEVKMTGQQDFDGDVDITAATVTLGTSQTPSLYTGQVTRLRASSDRWRLQAQLTPSGSGASIALQLTVSVAGDNAAQGTITAQSNGGDNGGNNGGDDNNGGNISTI